MNQRIGSSIILVFNTNSNSYISSSHQRISAATWILCCFYLCLFLSFICICIHFYLYLYLWFCLYYYPCVLSVFVCCCYFPFMSRMEMARVPFLQYLQPSGGRERAGTKVMVIFIYQHGSQIFSTTFFQDFLNFQCILKELHI